MHRRSDLLDRTIRRDIFDLLAAHPQLSIAGATARVAHEWSSRRERSGDTPAAVGTAGVLVLQIGAELAAESRRPRAGQRPGPGVGTRPGRLQRVAA